MSSSGGQLRVLGRMRCYGGCGKLLVRLVRAVETFLRDECDGEASAASSLIAPRLSPDFFCHVSSALFIARCGCAALEASPGTDQEFVLDLCQSAAEDRHVLWWNCLSGSIALIFPFLNVPPLEDDDEWQI